MDITDRPWRFVKTPASLADAHARPLEEQLKQMWPASPPPDDDDDDTTE
jgi:hypothetical protein